jgi:LacI family transcriptional regulator
MKATLNEVARLAKVSHTTVSNVVNNTKAVTEETRARVLKAIELLNYEHNVLARSLKTQKSNVIGVVISDNSNPLFSHVVRGIEDVASLYGYNVILCNTNQNVAREVVQLKTLFERQVDGVIISVADERAEHLDRFRDKPVVFVNRRPERQYGDVVLTDNFQGSFEAVTYLLALGHRRVGIVGCSPDYVTGRGRLRGYLEALKQFGVEPDERLIIQSTVTRKEDGLQAARRLLERTDPPTAIFGATYYSTLGIIAAASQLRLAIPGQVSVVGFDDPDWSECFAPPLTTVAQPGGEIGRKAAEALIARIENREAGPFQEILLTPELKVRASCLTVAN